MNEDQTTIDRRTSRRRTGRKAGRTVLAGVALAGVGLVWAGTAQAGQSTATATPTCKESALKATFGRQLAGGMNHQGVVINLRNLSGRTCVVRGYPGLGLENASHKAIKTHVTWGDTWYAKDPGKKTISLKDGQSVEAVVAWTHANTGTSGAVHASYLEITPPAATTHKTFAFKQWVDHGDLSVTALARHVEIND